MPIGNRKASRWRRMQISVSNRRSRRRTVLQDGVYHMLYGDWENICLATGSRWQDLRTPDSAKWQDRHFHGRHRRQSASVCLRIGDRCMSTARLPNKQGVVYCRTSPDLRQYSESTAVTFGGRSGVGGGTAECPQVVEHETASTISSALNTIKILMADRGRASMRRLTRWNSASIKIGSTLLLSFQSLPRKSLLIKARSTSLHSCRV